LPFDGILQSWSIEICVNSSDDFSLTGEFENLNMCTNETYNLPLTLGAGFDTDTDLIFESNNQSIVEITTIEGGVNYTLPDIFVTDQIYYWSVTGINRCGSIASEIRSFSIDQANSTQITNTLGLNIYPNPTEQFIHIQDQSNVLGKVNLLIHAIDGKLIYENSIQLGFGTYSIPVSNWRSGIYIITVCSSL